MKKIKINPPNPLEELLLGVKNGIRSLFPLTNELLDNLTFTPPPPHIEADYSFSTFSFSTVLKQDPSASASQIVTYFTKTPLSVVSKIYAIGPYVNIEVDGELYYQKVLEHISSLGKRFGTYHRTNSELIFINYAGSDLVPTLTLNSLRLLLIGQVIGRCYECGGDNVRHNYYVTDWEGKTGNNNPKLLKKWWQTILRCVQSVQKQNIHISHYDKESQFGPSSHEVVASALEQKLAEYISNTQAVITLPFESTPSLLLQKNNKLTTNLARHLAYIKNCLVKARPANLIYISLQKQSSAVEYLLVIAGQLGYVYPETKISTIAVCRTNLPEPLLKTNRAVQYAILRTPFANEVVLNSENLAYYYRIIHIINQLKTGSPTTNLSLSDKLRVTKLLVSFPGVITEVQSLNKPDRLCAYLEETAEICEKLSVSQDKKLSEVATTVLENGLKLITF